MNINAICFECICHHTIDDTREAPQTVGLSTTISIVIVVAVKKNKVLFVLNEIRLQCQWKKTIAPTSIRGWSSTLPLPFMRITTRHFACSMLCVCMYVGSTRLQITPHTVIVYGRREIYLYLWQCINTFSCDRPFKGIIIFAASLIHHSTDSTYSEGGSVCYALDTLVATRPDTLACWMHPNASSWNGYKQQRLILPKSFYCCTNNQPNRRGNCVCLV